MIALRQPDWGSIGLNILGSLLQHGKQSPLNICNIWIVLDVVQFMRVVFKIIHLACLGMIIVNQFMRFDAHSPQGKGYTCARWQQFPFVHRVFATVLVRFNQLAQG